MTALYQLVVIMCVSGAPHCDIMITPFETNQEKACTAVAAQVNATFGIKRDPEVPLMMEAFCFQRQPA